MVETTHIVWLPGTFQSLEYQTRIICASFTSSIEKKKKVLPPPGFDLHRAVERLVVVELFAQPDDDCRMGSNLQGYGLTLIAQVQRTI